MRPGIDRRALVAAGWAMALPACAAQPKRSTTELTAPSGRKIAVSIWEPATARGVLLFSTGHGSWPDAYEELVGALTGAGYAIVAPLHVDSMRHPDRERFTIEAAFMERLVDMGAVSKLVGQRWPGVPVGAVGHSLGSLISLGLGGALAHMAPLRDPTVKAVLAFSSPGKVEGVITPQAYASLQVPTLMITGDRDLVDGWVTNWRDHLYPIETAPPGDKYALTFAGVGHDLAGGEPPAAFREAVAISRGFLSGYVLSDRSAVAELRTAGAKNGERWLAR